MVGYSKHLAGLILSYALCQCSSLGQDLACTNTGIHSIARYIAVNYILLIMMHMRRPYCTQYNNNSYIVHWQMIGFFALLNVTKSP